MGVPLGDPNLVVNRAARPGAQELVIRDDVVQEWIAAYTDYATELQRIAGEIKRTHTVGDFGNLESLRQLAHGYDQLLIGGDGSLHQRLLEYAEVAMAVADKIRQQWQLILAEDAQTASSLSTGL